MQENVNLKPFNTFGLDVTSRYFDSFSSVSELTEILAHQKDKNLFVLGGGSNILLINNFEGITLKNEITGIEVIEENTEEIIVEVGAGQVWHEFVLYAIKKSWGGVENLSLIPGSVGASPMQNIGAYGVEIKDVFESLEAVEISTGKRRTFSHKECQFGYRESIFKRTLKDQFIITSVRYRLQKHPKINTKYGAINQELAKRKIDHPTIKDVSDAVISIRQSKLPDPKKIGNSGSFFKNPIISTKKFARLQKEFPALPSYPVNDQLVKVPAGWLIDKAGWKGKRFDNYGVHKNQSLVLVNYGGCNGNEIYALSEKIIADIEQVYGIRLEREVNVVG